MKPGAGHQWRDERGRIPVSILRRGCPGNDGADLFSVSLLYHPKAAKLALGPIVEAMMVGVVGDEVVAAHVVVRLHSLDDMHGERDASQPGSTGQLVGDIEP